MRFFSLAEALGSLGVWVRLHYVYPYPRVDHVLPLMAGGKVLTYLDIPFQHAGGNSGAAETVWKIQKALEAAGVEFSPGK